jgi:hypothetical protein
MKRTSLILIMVASAAAAIAQTSTSPAPAATPAAAPSATATSAAAPAAKPATTAAADAKPAETKPEPPKRPADVDDEGNPIYHPEAPPLVADIHCGETSKTCTINLPPGIPPTDAKLVDDFSLRYQDIKIGTGAEALPGKKYTLHYTGWNAASGSKFDSTYDHHANLKDKDGKPVMGGRWQAQAGPGAAAFHLQMGRSQGNSRLGTGHSGNEDRRKAPHHYSLPDGLWRVWASRAECRPPWRYS